MMSQYVSDLWLALSYFLSKFRLWAAAAAAAAAACCGGRGIDGGRFKTVLRRRKVAKYSYCFLKRLFYTKKQ
jgi:hypothetical protein